MSMNKEYYAAKPIPEGEIVVNSSHIAGFLASAAGTITLTDFDGTVLVNAMPVVAGFNRIPVLFNFPQGNIVNSSVAGTLLT